MIPKCTFDMRAYIITVGIPLLRPVTNNTIRPNISIFSFVITIIKL